MEALKAQIMGERSSAQNKKPTWSLGLSDEESDHDDAEKLLGGDSHQEDGNLLVK